MQFTHFQTCKDNNDYATEIPRFSTGSFRESQMHSECSDESYQSASVRLQNEVNQLHLFYNQKALIIEEKLKNKFHVCSPFAIKPLLVHITSLLFQYSFRLWHAGHV